MANYEHNGISKYADFMHDYNENIIHVHLWHTVIHLSGEALEAGLKRGLQKMGMDPPKERFRSY